MVANTSQSTTYKRKRLIESTVEQIKISFSVRLMRENDSFQMIPVLTKLDFFLFCDTAIGMLVICAHFVSLRQGPGFAGIDTR